MLVERQAEKARRPGAQRSRRIEFISPGLQETGDRGARGWCDCDQGGGGRTEGDSGALPLDF